MHVRADLAMSPWPSPPRASGVRLAGAAGVVLLHVVVIYALVTGLASRVVEVIHPPVVVRILDEAPPPKPPPALPPPRFVEPRPAFVPPPQVRIETPPPPPQTAITGVTSTPPVTAPPVPRQPAPVAAPVRAEPRLDIAKSRELDYPAASRRLGEQGSVTLQVLVDARGVATAVKLVESSGFARLDEAALSGVKSNYRFVPGSVDGKPEAMWFTFKFTWKLR
jgi:periplasmic protein TonB